MVDEKGHVRDMLVRDAYSLAEKVQDISRARYLMKTCREEIHRTAQMCQAIGLLDCEKYVCELLELADIVEKDIRDLERFETVVNEFCEFTKHCGIPMSPADPDLWQQISPRK